MRLVRAKDVTPVSGSTFTGEVALTRLLDQQTSSGMAVSLVRFADGARTNWHTHPGEQILYVIEGEGRAGTATEEHRLGPGDVVYAAPNERHWHGAAAGHGMVHLSVTTVGSPQWFEAPPE